MRWKFEKNKNWHGRAADEMVIAANQAYFRQVVLEVGKSQEREIRKAAKSTGEFAAQSGRCRVEPEKAWMG